MDTTAATAASSSSIPTALRHLLNKGTKHHHQNHAPQIDGIVQSVSKPTDSPSSPMHANHYPPAAVSHCSPASAYYTQRTLVASDPAILSTRASLDMGARAFHGADSTTSSQQSVRSVNSGIGAWFSRYSLRPSATNTNTGSRASANSTASTATSVSTINTITSSEYARHSIDSTLANMQLTATQQHHSYQHQQQGLQPPQQQGQEQAFAAVITNVEICEASAAAAGSSAAAGLRKSSSRNKRHVVYRILVSGRDGQWWAMRRYSEFHDLFSVLKKRAPQPSLACTTGTGSLSTSTKWSDLFPTKRWGLPPSIEVAAQWTEKLNLFLRAITADTDICQSDEVQVFLCETPAAIPASLSLIELPTAAMSPSSSGYKMQMPGEWESGDIAGTNDSRTVRDAMVRISMPVLKDSQTSFNTSRVSFDVSQVATPPTSGPKSIPDIAEGPNALFSVPSSGSQAGAAPPAIPPRPAKHQTMEYAKSPFTTAMSDDEASSQVLRKASDSLLYLSAEKRPNIEPLTTRKKYGLRGNLQYVTQTYATEQGRDSRGDSMALDGRDIIDSENSPDVAPPEMVKANTWGIQQHYQHQHQHQQRNASGSEDVEMASPEPSYRPTPPPRPALHIARQQSSRPQLASLAVRGNIQHAQLFHKQQRQVSGTPSLSSKGVNMLMSAVAADPLRSAPPSIKQFNESDNTVYSKKSVGLDDFHLLSIIGKGSYGQVMLARYKDTGKVMAIKVISKSKLRGRPNEIRRVMSERKVLERTVEHPFLVGLQCAFQTKEKLFFCLDYVNGGELFFHLQRERRFSENRARFYAAEITCALEYLHGMGVVYRDLKPENCLLDADGHVKIVDFGLAKEVGPVVWRTEGSALYSVEEGGKTGTFCGTPEYLAPEVLLRQRYGKEVDWYCLGAVLYEMLTGLPPFYDQDNNIMYKRILQEPLRFPTVLPPPLRGNGSYNESSSVNASSNGIGKLAQDFISRILERDPQKRLGNGVFGTENVKRHVFFHGIDWAKVYKQEYAPPFVPKVSSIFDLSNIDPEFRNEPIPESILAEGQVDIIAEAAEAERQADLALQAQLMAFPSPLNTPVAMSGAYFQQSRTLGVSSPQSMNSVVRSPYSENNGDAFQGFAFMSPYVDAPDDS
ncbi:kinase-like domain-containing protein [Coemansia spiralis]|nr:kinase-like domain-containing protein [Coemansia spiralis]